MEEEEVVSDIIQVLSSSLKFFRNLVDQLHTTFLAKMY